MKKTATKVIPLPFGESHLINNTCVADYTLSQRANIAYQNRVKFPLEQIHEICMEITHIYKKYVKNQRDYVDACRKDAIIIRTRYDELVALAQQVQVKDYPYLINTLSILCIQDIAWVMSDQMDEKINIPNKREQSLYHALRNIAYDYDIVNKYEFEYSEQFKQAHIDDIIKLEKKGEHLCESKDLYEWYRTHIHDYNASKTFNWRKKHEYEMNNAKTFPWERRGGSHRLKVGTKFRLDKTKKIEVIDINDFQRLSCLYNLPYNYTDNGSDYEGIAIKHIGTENSGTIELLSAYELKTYMEANGYRNFDKYFFF
jgi:hypothetical protein